MRISVDDMGVQAAWRDGRRMRIPWPALVHIALVWIPRDDRFFWQDPCYWELQSDDSTRLPIYCREARRIHLLDSLERLPGFRRETAERALSQRALSYASVWSRPSVLCPSCGEATLVEGEQMAKLCHQHLLVCPLCGHKLAVGRARLLVFDG
jgi:hypothetical protein